MIEDILQGIDKTETESKDGWWETSTGAEFGDKKLAEVVAYHERVVREKDDFIRVLKDALEQSSPNLLLKKQIATLTAENERLRKALEVIAVCLDLSNPNGKGYSINDLHRIAQAALREKEDQVDKSPCLGDCVHINETVICTKCGPENYLYESHIQEDQDGQE